MRYEGQITYTGDDGKTKRHSVYGRTRQDVRDKLKKARDRLDAGAPVRDATRTVGDWLAQWRVTTLAVSDHKESTRTLYGTLCSKHLEPAPFGAIPLNRLRPSDVEALILAMRAKTSKLWQAAIKNLDVPQVRLHDARHTCATLMHLQGVPIALVAAWLGHAACHSLFVLTCMLNPKRWQSPRVASARTRQALATDALARAFGDTFRGTCSRSGHLGHTQVCNRQLEVALVEHLGVCFLTARSSDPVQLVLVPLHRFDAVEGRRGHATTGCSVD
jgi:KaiC/GvpD/RAD55 family RecA-like ATPase